MRISFAKLLIVIALCIVVLLEARTALAFFDIDVSLFGIVVVGVLVIGGLIVWALYPETDEPQN